MTHNEWSMVIHHRGGGRLAEGSDVRFEWSYRSPTGSPQAKWELEFAPLTAPAEERESGRVVRSGTTENEYIIDPALYDDMWRWSLTVWDSNGNGSNIGSGEITVAVAPQLVEPPVGTFLDSFDVPIESISTDHETAHCDVDGHRVTCTIGFRLGYSGDQLQMCPTPGPEMPNPYYRVVLREEGPLFSRNVAEWHMVFLYRLYENGTVLFDRAIAEVVSFADDWRPSGDPWYVASRPQVPADMGTAHVANQFVSSLSRKFLGTVLAELGMEHGVRGEGGFLIREPLGSYWTAPSAIIVFFEAGACMSGI